METENLFGSANEYSVLWKCLYLDDKIVLFEHCVLDSREEIYEHTWLTQLLKWLGDTFGIDQLSRIEGKLVNVTYHFKYESVRNIDEEEAGQMCKDDENSEGS